MSDTLTAARPAERAPARGRARTILRDAVPSAVLFVVIVVVWQAVCVVFDVPTFVFPSPLDVAGAFVEHGALIFSASLVTLWEAVLAFAFSLVIGVSLAILLASARWIELSTYPYVIVLQTIPSVAIAPLIIIWFGVTTTSVVIIAVIMGFVPILSGMLSGLRSADKNLGDLFELLNAPRWEAMLRLRIPAALPYLVSGVRTGSTLVVIGVIVGEYISGIGSGNAGLGFVITKSAIRLETPTLFAAGIACAILGIAFYQAVKQISKLLLGRWHESEMTAES